MLKNIYSGVMPLKKSLFDDKLEAGIDEAGAGVLIGRVYTAVVIMPNDCRDVGIKDSKKLSAKKRRQLREFIQKNAIDYAVDYATEDEVDKYNILEARLMSMRRAVDKLSILPNYLLIDGDRFKPYIDREGEMMPYSTLEDGDNRFISIASASILAKTYHDDYINELCQQYPVLLEYGIDKNMGYGTEKHMKTIKEKGITKFHRKTFRPCQGKTIVDV